MKPIKIVMSAFGSYADKIEISFEEVNGGLFLISGDTGAGKTTIFDAITYALYEQTSGGIRDGNMMRSQFADSDTLTYVELTFKYQGEIYKIKRNPQYERRAKRKTADGNGFTTEAPKVELTLPDGKVFMGNKTETNNKITEVLGIDKEQFTQIAMIAQGDFLKLLHANSDERKRIFSKIFDTRIYSRIQDVLQSKLKEINTELAKNKTLCEHEMKNVSCIEGSIYENQWIDMYSGFEFKTDEVLTLIESINKEIKEAENTIISSKEKMQVSFNEINMAINSAEAINAMFKKLKLARDMKIELYNKKEEHHNNEIRLNSAKRAEIIKPEENRYIDKLNSLREIEKRIFIINKWLVDNENQLLALSENLAMCEKNKNENEEKLNHSIARINDTIDKYDELEQKKALIVDIEKEKLSLEQNISKLKAEIENLNLWKLKLDSEQDSLKNCYTEFTDAQLKVKDIEKNVIELDELNKLAGELSLSKDKYDISIIEANKALNTYSASNEIYEKLYRAFLSEQAGILAKERLKENIPCPVCGSTSHPSIAVVSEHAPTQADVENAKQKRDIAEKNSSLVNENLQAIKQQYTMSKELVLNKARLLVKEDFSIEADINLIYQLLEKFKKELEQYKIILNMAISNKAKYEANIVSLENISKQILAKSSNLDEITNKYNEIKIEFATINSNIEDIKKHLYFKSKAEAVQGLNMRKAKLHELNKAVNDATNNYNNMLRQIEARKGQQKSELDNQIRVNAEVEECKESYYGFIKANKFSSEEEYKKSKLTLNQIEALQSQIDDYNKKLSDTDNEIRIYTEQTEGKTEIAVTDMIKTKDDLAISLQEIEKEFKQIYALDRKNSDARANIDKLFKQRKEIKSQYEIYNSLNATANGNISGKIKMDFETYIQRQYFNKIIAAANKRLDRMTSGQFLLQCRELTDLGNRGPVGLDLDVYSLLTDTTRDIKTLSGGESFMAALSMALGLSDVIQATAGAVHLDTMFIDEGFGSLDDSSRGQAINVLNELAGNNRLVGIISHVNELKEQIDNRLVVKKSDKGSTVYWAK